MNPLQQRLASGKCWTNAGRCYHHHAPIRRWGSLSCHPTAEEAFPCSDSSYPPLEDLAQDTTPVSALAHITFSTLICLYFSLEHVIIYAVQGYRVFSKWLSCLINEAVNWSRGRGHFYSPQCLPQCLMAERSSKITVGSSICFHFLIVN